MLPQGRDRPIDVIGSRFAANREVRDVIHAGGGGLLDRHAVRNVARHRHAEPVRIGGDRLDDRRRNQTVDLDLLKSGVVVLADDLPSLLRSGGGVDPESIRPAAIDKAGKQTSRGPTARPAAIASRSGVMNSNSLPMSRTVVTPAATYTGAHSTCVTCVCMSHRPGTTVFFPPIRQYLLECGITVSSFDKRGVGDSTGRWQEAAIEEQASDAIACLEALRADASSNGRVGLYGHSQGGWASSRLRLVVHGRRCVTSSGPGVTPAAQERWATRTYVARSDIPEEEIEEVERYYDRVLSMMRAGMPLARARKELEESGFPSAFETLSLPVLPEDDGEWRLRPLSSTMTRGPRSSATACRC